MEKNFKITTTIYSNSERSERFLKENTFLTSSWRFFKSNDLEGFTFKTGKKLGFRNLQEKFEKEGIYSGQNILCNIVVNILLGRL